MNHISSSPIDLNHVLALAHHAKAGAIVLFSGETRNHQESESVDFLEYEAHLEMGEKVISQIIEEAKKQWQLHFVYAQHRIGKVMISECAVVVATSASHRDEAYQANRYIIDRIKAEAPIWKKEFFTEGKGIWR